MGSENAGTSAKARRGRRNVVLFIVSYVINNLASGVLYDTYVNYLQDVANSAATSFWAFYGYATFVAAALLLLVPLGIGKIRKMKGEVNAHELGKIRR